MHSGVILLNALQVNTALLYLILALTDSQPSSRSIVEDGVSKSAWSMIRAARFCNFDSLLIFVEDVDPHVTEP